MSIKLQEIESLYILENNAKYIVEVDCKLTYEIKEQVLKSLKDFTKGMNVEWMLFDSGMKVYKGE